MQPYPTNTLKMRVTSVKANAAGVTTVAWSNGSGMTPYSAGAALSRTCWGQRPSSGASRRCGGHSSSRRCGG